MKLVIVGATGRMGLTIARLAKDFGAELVGAVASPNDPAIGRDIGELAGAGSAGVVVQADIASALLGAKVAIDFSSPAVLPRLCQAAAKAKVALVSGTTRIDEAGTRALDEASKQVPVLWSPNTSIGVYVLASLAKIAARELGPDFDVEIVETHHKAKVDAPSGTAMRLAEAVKEARHELAVVTGREGNVGPRAPSEIGVLALRGGDVIGDHSVHFLGAGERIELVHRATNRELFARGALRAARAIVGQKPGRYGMEDVVARAMASAS